MFFGFFGEPPSKGGQNPPPTEEDLRNRPRPPGGSGCDATLSAAAAARKSVSEMLGRDKQALRWQVLKINLELGLLDFGRGTMTPPEKAAYQLALVNIVELVEHIESLIPD